MSTLQVFVQYGPQAGRAFALDKPSLSIGREAGNDIVLDSPQISRYHARLTLQGNVYVIEDLGSTNGVLVNGQRATRPVPITAGDVLGLGEGIVLRVQGSAAETIMDRGQPIMSPPPVYAPAAPVYQPPAPAYAPPPPVYAPPAPVYAPPPYYPPPSSNSSSCWLWGCGCLLALSVATGCLGVIAALTPFGAVLLGLIPPGLLGP